MAGTTRGPAAGRRRCASLSLLRFRKAGVLPRRPAPGPGGARRRRLRARRKPAALLLETRPGLPALLAAPGRVQGRQALLLQSPPAGLSERPCRASGRLLIRPAAQQLLGKVGLLHTAAATGAEQRAASAAATVQCDRTAPPGAPRMHLRRPSLHLPRSQHELLYYGTKGRGHDLAFHSELRDALFTSGLPFVLSINAVPEAWELYSRADSITRLCSGKNSSKPELLVLRRGNPAVCAGMGGASLR